MAKPKIHRSVSKLNEQYPTDCPTLQSVRQEYADWCWCMDDGYIRYFDPKYIKSIYEHQLVAHKAYGFLREKGIHVHHKNENRSDNRAENLQMLTAAEHINHHRKYVAPDVELAFCPHCGEELELHGFAKQRQSKNYCSRYCADMDMRKVERPSAAVLESQIRAVGNITAIGRIYGVSPTCIRKWARAYGIQL